MVPTMADRIDRPRRPARAPVRASTRRKWLIIGGMSALWLLLLVGTGSMFLATVLLGLITLLAVACWVVLRSLGVDGDHPVVQRMAERPWRDGRDVLQQGLRHLPEVFLVSPSGSLLAPNVVELYLNPDDLASLTDTMDLDLISSSAAEVYQSQIAESGARLGSDGPVEVRVAADPAVPAGRYRIRQGRPVSASSLVGAPPLGFGQPLGGGQPLAAGQPVGAGQPFNAVQPLDAGPARDAGPQVSAVIGGRRVPFNGHDGYTQREEAGFRGVPTDMITAESPAIPPLQLVTNGSVVETRLSGARAGRSGTAELVLPAEPTVSRVHARFVFTDGQWWITSLGRNGITLNGVPVAGQRPVSDGDAILWGAGSGALMSRVRIG